MSFTEGHLPSVSSQVATGTFSNISPFPTWTLPESSLQMHLCVEPFAPIAPTASSLLSTQMHGAPSHSGKCECVTFAAVPPITVILQFESSKGFVHFPENVWTCSVSRYFSARCRLGKSLVDFSAYLLLLKLTAAPTTQQPGEEKELVPFLLIVTFSTNVKENALAGSTSFKPAGSSSVSETRSLCPPAQGSGETFSPLDNLPFPFYMSIWDGATRRVI